MAQSPRSASDGQSATAIMRQVFRSGTDRAGGRCARQGGAVLAGSVLLAGTAMLASSLAVATPPPAAAAEICTASPVNGQTNTALADKLSANISKALNGRAGTAR
jgi:hypothetical protein